ncbi:MAG TPA: VWA domain-containing protein, partial [Thermoanaerobaculia bacterium]|nr:VWA domain-containing protein [Thermoanaerobaculia bacterium]
MRSLVDHLAVFAAELRARGVPVTLWDESDAAEALTLVDVAEREEVRRTLRIALKIRPRHAGIFDAFFDALWSVRAGPAAISEAARQRAVPHAAPRLAAFPAAGAGTGQSVERETPQGDTPAWSPEALLRRKPFDACTAEDLAAMERILARLAEKLATRPSRRLVPSRSRGAVDPRRSFRAALATQGELLRLARRARAIEEPRIVALCDTSGSMDTHTRFLLGFLMALKSVARRTEIFVFNTA